MRNGCPESQICREFEITRPRILGTLLDAIVQGLRETARVHLDRLPRMAASPFGLLLVKQRCGPFLRTLCIEVAFSRERAGRGRE
jgi:hypothetical protein